MSDFTDTFEEHVISWIADGTSMPTAPTGLQISLHTQDPGDTVEIADPTSTELDPATNDGYSRLNVELTVFDGTTNGVRSNNEALTFGPALNADWPTVSHFVVWNSDGSIPLYASALDQSVTVPQDEGLTFSAGNLTLQVD